MDGKRQMTLPQQAELVEYVLSNWRAPKDERIAVSPIWLRKEDVDDLMTVAKTLRVLGAHGVDQYVRDKVAREKKGRGR